jgi:hypothetical protein
MTDYYADFDLGTGNNDGSDWDNAWQTMADALAGTNSSAPAAGDTVYCRGTDTLSSGVEITSSNSGTEAGGHCKFIGVDASGNNVGGSTRAVLDGNDGAFDIMVFNGCHYFWLENFEIHNTNEASGNDGIRSAAAYSNYARFINVIVHNCHTGIDCESGYLRYATFLRCRCYDNASNGWEDPRYCLLAFCRSDNNSSYGFKGYNTGFIGCIAHDNGADGFYLYGALDASFSAFSCVSYNNTDDGYDTLTSSPLLCCRSASNGGHGVEVDSGERTQIFYYYGDDTNEITGYYDEVLNDGSSTITTNGTDTDEGFEDPASDDYNLTSAATYRREAVEIP